MIRSINGRIAPLSMYPVASSSCVWGKRAVHTNINPWEKTFIEIHEKPNNKEKLDLLFWKYLQVTLRDLGCSCPASTEEAWEKFQAFVSSAKDANQDPYVHMQTHPLASYKAQNAMNKA